jgi:hypothetical protein
VTAILWASRAVALVLGVLVWNIGLTYLPWPALALVTATAFAAWVNGYAEAEVG